VFADRPKALTLLGHGTAVDGNRKIGGPTNGLNARRESTLRLGDSVLRSLEAASYCITIKVTSSFNVESEEAVHVVTKQVGWMVLWLVHEALRKALV